MTWGVVDLRTIASFDDETVCAEVRRTGRAVVIAEAPGFAVPASEIAARVGERCFRQLAATAPSADRGMPCRT